MNQYNRSQRLKWRLKEKNQGIGNQVTLWPDLLRKVYSCVLIEFSLLNNQKILTGLALGMHCLITTALQKRMSLFCPYRQGNKHHADWLVSITQQSRASHVNSLLLDSQPLALTQ